MKKQIIIIAAGVLMTIGMAAFAINMTGDPCSTQGCTPEQCESSCGDPGCCICK